MTFDYLPAELEEKALDALLHHNPLPGLIPEAKPIAITAPPPHGSLRP
jgi:hypothetical protein